MRLGKKKEGCGCGWGDCNHCGSSGPKGVTKSGSCNQKVGKSYRQCSTATGEEASSKGVIPATQSRPSEGPGQLETGGGGGLDPQMSERIRKGQLLSPMDITEFKKLAVASEKRRIGRRKSKYGAPTGFSSNPGGGGVGGTGSTG